MTGSITARNTVTDGITDWGRQYPQLAVFGPRLDKLFRECDKEGKGQIGQDGAERMR